MSLFYVANPLEAKCKGPRQEPFVVSDWRLFGGHVRFDIGQGAVDADQYPLLAHQRHYGVGDAREIGPDRYYSAAIRASI